MSASKGNAINLLSYTSLSTSPCAEHLHLPQGSACMSKEAIKKIKPLIKGQKSKRPKRLITADIESIPNDGSDESNTVRKLMAIYNCKTERDLLSNVSIVEKLGVESTKEEISRFKLRSNRRGISSGTDTDDEYKVLKEWEKVFPTFFSLPVAIHINGFESNLLTDVNLTELIEKYPDKKMFAIPLAITVYDDDQGIHAVGVFVDIRLDDWSIEYFDSSGSPPKKIITTWMESQRKLLKKIYKNKIETFVTKNLVHQLTSTECGLHVLIYYRRRIEGIPYQLFRTSKIPDEVAINFRKRIYS